MPKIGVLIVGAGPAGLATAIALKRSGYPGRVVVLEKGRRVSNHSLSGAVVDPAGFEDLLNEDEIAKLPIGSMVAKESFRFLFSPHASVKIPWVPPMMRAKGYPIISLAKLVRYLAEIATKLGAEVYPSFAAVETIEENGCIVGVRTGDKGVDSNGNKKDGYLASEEVRAKIVILAEGAAGVLTGKVADKYQLNGCRPQSYALGIREVLELNDPDEGRAGEIMHTFGFPVDSCTYGGGFVYHLDKRHIAVGFAVGLDYHDSRLDPYALFQRYKESSLIAAHIKDAKVVSYGAKLIPEGGWYALMRPYAPGALIVGDNAGLVDGLRIKGVHIALESGVAAAKAILGGDEGIGERYFELLKATRGYREIKRVRNVHGGFSYNALFGVVQAGLAWVTFGRFPFWMVGSKKCDAKSIKELGRDDQHEGRSVLLGQKLLDDVYLSGVVHEENQPSHIRLRDAEKCAECMQRFGAPCLVFCPGAVYRREGERIAIEFSNCLHCHTCSDKCPFGNVEWNFPEGGGGPKYD